MAGAAPKHAIENRGRTPHGAVHAKCDVSSIGQPCPPEGLWLNGKFIRIGKIKARRLVRRAFS
jgi:hypothetical protein